MANENDNINQEGADGTEQPKHHTWKDIVSEEFQKINTEFPLSGGETDEDLASVDDTEEGEEKPKDSNETTAETPAGHHSLFDNIIDKIQKLDTEFPLSGGETDEDLEGIDDKEEGE